MKTCSFFILCFFVSVQSFSCICKGSLDPFYKNNLTKNYYFTGIVISEENVGGKFPKRKYTVLISKYFNANIAKDTFEVYSSKGSCGIKLEIGKEYILGATKGSESYIGVCLLHARVDEKKDLILKLEKN